MKLRFLTSLLCLFTIASAAMAAQINSGKVYRLINHNGDNMSLTITASGLQAGLAAVNAADTRQQWYLTANSDGTGYYFRNVASGAYLKSPKTSGVQWPVVVTTAPEDDSMVLSVEPRGDFYVFRALSQKSASLGSNVFGHFQTNGNALVCWNGNDGTSASFWNFAEVPMTQAQIDEMLKRFEDQTQIKANVGVYQEHLDNLFEDKACTRLRAEVTGSLESNEHYLALPQVLKAMALKVKTDNWAETNPKAEVRDWSSQYAKKYRVQLYEPFSEGSAAAGLAGIQAYTNMNNPTGILADSNELVYIMVDNDIPAGSTLYIGTAPDDGMYNSTTSGVPLHKGLNILTCYGDHSHFFVYYTVNTVSGGKHTEYKVTEFPDIKIHIEGGCLNGFFNYVGDRLYGQDTQKDFEYTVQRATHPMYDFLGKYVILHLHLFDTPSQAGQPNQRCVKTSMFTDKTAGADREHDPVKIMTAWDNMCLAERILMGIQSDDEIELPYNKGYYETIVRDNYSQTFNGVTYSADPGFHYSDYFNNRMMGISQQGTLFMNATSWRTAYNVSTIEAILTQFCNGDIWGPAHEYGHMNQPPMNMAGTTEESNNIFSNVAVYYVGKTTSRSDFLSKQLELFEEGKTFLDHGTWGTTRMFWQLWLYYHATGHNKKFYPRLYELLRHHPIKKTTVAGGNHNELYDKLHFARMCCIAAEEDLTDFFTAWGFFVPLNGYFIDDYSQYNAVLSQADIDAVKEEIKSYNFPKNNAIILIDDRPGSTRNSFSGFPKEQAGELGGLGDFQAGSEKRPSGNFTFTTDVNTVNVETDGQPGPGYLIYDEDGNLLAFSNSNSFEVSPEVMEKLMNGEARVEAVAADNSDPAPVVNLINDGTPEQKKEVLADLINSCGALLGLVDEEEKKVGFIKPSAASSLKAQTETARSLYENDNATGTELTKLIKELTECYKSLLDDKDALIRIEPGSTYVMRNFNYSDRILSTDMSKCTAPVNNEGQEVSLEQQWTFEPTGNENEYYIRNLLTSQYINKAAKQSVSFPVSTSTQRFTLVEIGNLLNKTGVFSFAPDNNRSLGLHVDASRNVVAWTTSSNPTQWYITKVHDKEYVDLRNTYAEVIEECRNIFENSGETATVEPEKLIFDTNIDSGDLYTNAPYTASNNSDTFRGWECLFDSNVTTYFHSDYSGNNSKDGLDHYIRFRAPNGGTFDWFTFSYTTRNTTGNSTNITAITIQGSPDMENWTNLYSVSSGLKTTPSTVNTLPENKAPEGTKYIRFMVNKSGEQRGGHYYFAISGVEIKNRKKLVSCTPADDYEHLSPEEMEDFYYVIKNAETDQTLASHTNESLQKAIEDLRRKKVEYEANLSKAEITFITFDASLLSERIDNAETTMPCMSFRSGAIRIWDFMKVTTENSQINADDIEVTVMPAGSENWASASGSEDELDQAYRQAFEATAPESSLWQQYSDLKSHQVDGFFTNCDGRLERGSENGVYDLVLSMPCSGVYNISFKSKNDNFIIVDQGHDNNPAFDLEIYPNLLNSYSKEHTFNIEGFSYDMEDRESVKTIFLPKDFIESKGKEMTNCMAYTPGIYFADEFKVSVQGGEEDRGPGSIGYIKRKEDSTEPTVADASKYKASANLSNLDQNGKTISVTIAKNGASATYLFRVAPGDNKNVSTDIREIEFEEHDNATYYNLQGILVKNPERGIYIRVCDGRREKVMVK